MTGVVGKTSTPDIGNCKIFYYLLEFLPAFNVTN